MERKKTGLFSSGLVWFGAGVSIAEIMTGTYLQPLGFGKGLLAIFLGHGIGCILLFFAGLIGGRTEKSAMETVKLSFGQKGSILFAVCNVLQLVGWTAIMIYDGALSANSIFGMGIWAWALIIGALILVWILIGLKNLGIVNTIAMAALFGLTIVLSVIIFRETSPAASAEEGLSFGAALELSVAMPLSWFPLISDYTRDAERPFAATMVSSVTYGLVSCWMFIIGMGAAIYTGESDIAAIMLKAGLGILGLIIIIFSTVTTTFLDAFSAGVSCVTIHPRIPEKWAAVAVTIIGTAAACIFPMDNITDFLYLIGSVFAPMIAIQIADYFLLRQDSSGKSFDLLNLLIWGAGFAGYRLLMLVDIPVGSTLPDMIGTMLLVLIVRSTARAITGKRKGTGSSR